MTPDALILSANSGYARRIVGWIGGAHRGHLVSTRWREARALIIRGRRPVVIFDADQPIATVDQVLRTSSGANRPVIVISKKLDSARWIEYFRAGAFDVLRAPVEPRQLRQALSAARRAIGLPDTPPPGVWWPPRAIWRTLRSLLLD